jgi:hypothetical protein
VVLRPARPGAAGAMAVRVRAGDGSSRLLRMGPGTSRQRAQAGTLDV